MANATLASPHRTITTAATPAGAPAQQPNVLLTGGEDAGIPEPLRLHHTARPDGPVKLFLGNRYEHFEPTADVRYLDGRALRVHIWTRRTYVAE